MHFTHLGSVATIFAWISVICLSFHIFVFTAIKKLRTPTAQIHLALTCSLCPAQFLYAIGLSYTSSHSICVLIATFLHYFYLVAAFWMNILHLDLCRVCFKRSILKKVSSSAREALTNHVDSKRFKYDWEKFPKYCQKSVEIGQKIVKRGQNWSKTLIVSTWLMNAPQRGKSGQV